MADVLNSLLSQHIGQSLDVATAYFTVGGWQLLSEELSRLGTFRLLLGDEPESGADLGLRPVTNKPVKGLLHELAGAEFNEQNLHLVEDLIAFLRRENVQVRLYSHGFLHAKGYLFYSGGGFDRFAPVAAIVGSSNFTRPGLVSNKELNLSHRAALTIEELASGRVMPLLESNEQQVLAQASTESQMVVASVPGRLAIAELSEWYDRQWEASRDFKQDLIELLDSSKFGAREYTPYQVYLKAIFEYFRDELDGADNTANVRSAVELSEFQEDAVKKARKILARYDGVIIADSVGLGKTWIGKKLLEDYAYHQRFKALVICPASLRKMWTDELQSATIAAHIVTQEELGREEFEPRPLVNADIVLIDESHNFRNRNAQRYEMLERILAGNQRRGGVSGERKKLILLTATPINNTVFDLYNQINLVTGGDRSYFAAAGIGDLHRFFQAARRARGDQDSSIALFNLLEEVVIRRTRPFIKATYPNATINGKLITWPERRLKTIRYDLEATYSGIYERIVSRIEGLRLAPYRLEMYKKTGVNRDEFEEGREEALVGIFKSRYLKRFESSVDAFRISMRRALEFLETFESYILEGKILDSASFQKALRFLTREDEEDDATPNSRSEELDSNQEARKYIEQLPTLNAALYDLKRLHADLRKDVDALREIWQDIAPITAQRDAKLDTLKQLLAGELKGQKVLIFTYYKDTARYLYRQLTEATPAAEVWRTGAGEPTIRRMDSGADAKERANLVARFAPQANNRPELVGTEDEIDVLISTDVLSEGQNLQDCGVLVNYDLHWNPTRMVQRAGRIDRIGTTYQTLWVMNMFPDAGLEKLLGLVESLSRKIADIDRQGLLDASILGEAVHPRNFNTLRRIEQEDGKVVEEEEQFAELASSEFMLQILKTQLLDARMRTVLEELPDGIHSGLARADTKGVFFYFVAEGKQNGRTRGGREHFWRYIDLIDGKGGRIEDNRYVITNLIQCQQDTPRFVPPPGEVDIFALQERVIASIVQSSVEQVAVEEAPKLLDPIQQTIITTLRQFMNSPQVNRKAIIEAVQRLNEPQPAVYVKTLRKAYEAFAASGDTLQLLTAVQALDTTSNAPNIANGIDMANENAPSESKQPIKRKDLKLICFDYLWQ